MEDLMWLERKKTIFKKSSIHHLSANLPLHSSGTFSLKLKHQQKDTTAAIWHAQHSVHSQWSALVISTPFINSCHRNRIETCLTANTEPQYTSTPLEYSFGLVPSTHTWYQIYKKTKKHNHSPSGTFIWKSVWQTGRAAEAAAAVSDKPWVINVGGEGGIYVKVCSHWFLHVCWLVIISG